MTHPHVGWMDFRTVLTLLFAVGAGSRMDMPQVHVSLGADRLILTSKRPSGDKDKDKKKDK